MGSAGYLIDLQVMEYGEVLRIQREIHRRRLADLTKDTLILVEHPEVITLGKGGDKGNLLVPLSDLKRKGIGFYQTERGGDVTFHGPGQLVGYPIFSLKDGLAGVRPFVRGLESALIFALRRLGVEGERRPPGTGVWVGEAKIASIGVAVKKWVTLHGFALNVSPNLDHFRLINPCGNPDQHMTSIERLLGRSVSVEEAKREVKLAIERVFNLQLSEVKFEARLA